MHEGERVMAMAARYGYMSHAHLLIELSGAADACAAQSSSHEGISDLGLLEETLGNVSYS